MRNITIKQLRIVLAAARGGSFAAAAQAVHLTPPAVTMQIKALEDEIGLPLFDRGDKRLRPTLAGEEMISTALRIEQLLADAATFIAGLSDAESGTVSVGVVSTAKYFAPFALGAFSAQHPRIELKLTIGNRGEIIQRFSRMEFDIAIMGRPAVGVDVDSAEIGDNPHIIVAAPNNALVARHGLVPVDLADHAFLMREPGSGTRMLTEGLFSGTGRMPKVAMEISSNETIKQAVMANLGIALISAHTVAKELGDGRLVMVPVAGLPITRKWFVVTLKAKRLLPAAMLLRDFWVDQGARFLPQLPPLT